MKHKKIEIFETNAGYKESMKKVPKGYRVLSCGEVCDLYFDDREALRGIPQYESFWCNNGVSRLGSCSFDGDSDFDAGILDVDDHSLSGVFVVKNDILPRTKVRGFQR